MLVALAVVDDVAVRMLVDVTMAVRVVVVP